MSFSKSSKYRLTELYSVSSGLSKGRKDFGFGYHFVSFKDVFYNYFLPKELANLANTSEKERTRCSVKKGDLFITRTSETQEELGMSCVALKDYEEATFNGFTKRLRLKDEFQNKIDPLYIGYYMRSSIVRNQINSLSIMTTRASLNNSMIDMIEVEIPSLIEQELIGSILNKIDKKIEVNYQINKTLEKMAQAIFKQWFVDFEFPNVDGESYQSSGGEMVESELGMIPKGWKAVNIKNYSDKIANGGTPSRKKTEFWNSKDIPWIKTTEIKDNLIIKSDEYISMEGYENSSAKLFSKNTVLIAMYGATAGKLSLLRFEASTNQACCGVNALSKSPFYLYICLKNKQEELKSLATGSAQQNLSKKVIEGFKIIEPPEFLLCKFNEIMTPIYDLIENNTKEFESLTTTRDNLLPKLMLGEIRVQLD